ARPAQSESSTRESSHESFSGSSSSSCPPWPPGRSRSPKIDIDPAALGPITDRPGISRRWFLLTETGRTGALVAPTVGGTAQPLTSSGIDDHEIVWSHDSSKVLVVRGNGTDRAMWVVNSNGSGLINLTPGSHPRWSFDDRYILFDTARDGNREVYRMDAN